MLKHNSKRWCVNMVKQILCPPFPVIFVKTKKIFSIYFIVTAVKIISNDKKLNKSSICVSIHSCKSFHKSRKYIVLLQSDANI